MKRHSSLRQKRMACLAWTASLGAMLAPAAPAQEYSGPFEADTGLVSQGIYADAIYLDGYLILDGGYVVGTPSLAIVNPEFDTLTVEAGLAVGGDFSLHTLLSFGAWMNASATLYGSQIRFHDAGDSTSSNITHFATSEAAKWTWWQDDALSTAKEQLRLSELGTLTLSNPGSGNTVAIAPGSLTITLHPDGGSPQVLNWLSSSVNPSATLLSLAAGSLTVNATTNTMKFGNMTLVAHPATGNFVLSDAREGDSIVLGAEDKWVSFANGFGFGIAANAGSIVLGGGGGVAIGGNASASANGSVAIGGGNATGNYSVAIGAGSIAANSSAIAIAGGNATGTNSLAMGNGTTASAPHALALGAGTVAQTWGLTAVGHYNQATGSTSSWQSADPAFVVGIGNGTNSATALAVFNNGTAVFTNSTIVNENMQVDGATLLNGKATFTGNVIFNRPLGGFPMGSFGN